MDIQNSRSKELLDKVYNHLNSIDLEKLSMSELKDFLEVVQKGQFLESFGKVPPYGCGFGGMSAATFNSLGRPSETKNSAEPADKQG